jgi:hypothetical protein
MINDLRSGIDSEHPKKDCILVTRISDGLRGGQNRVLSFLRAFASLREFILRSLPYLLFKAGQNEIPANSGVDSISAP